MRARPVVFGKPQTEVYKPCLPYALCDRQSGDTDTRRPPHCVPTKRRHLDDRSGDCELSAFRYIDLGASQNRTRSHRYRVRSCTGISQMELRHLRYFVAVAEEHSFTRAAERLRIKQPPLSTQIRQLEVEIGTPLFRRLTRGVELTGAGKLFLEEARNILEHVERAKTEVKRRARGETGQIRIGLAAATYFEPLVNPVRHYPLRRSDASRPHPSRPAAERSGARKPYLPCESG